MTTRNAARARRTLALAGGVVGLSLIAAGPAAQPATGQGAIPPEIAAKMAAAAKAKDNAKKEFPPFEEVIEGYDLVISTADGRSLYDVYTKDKEGKVLAALPANFEQQTCFLAPTMAEGVPAANSSFIDGYMVRWKRIGDRLALMQPRMDVRSTGDVESQKSVNMQFTDRVVVDIPIVTMGPKGGPVIDLSELLVDMGPKVLPFLPRLNSRITEIAKAKAFPENIELAFRGPSADGTLVTLHYSWSVLPENTGYKPRAADYRVGYFNTVFDDLDKVGDADITTRYVNRWKIEKADPSLKMSPPKEPIVFYIEHTTPIEYRQAVREGILEWNKAYEQVGIVNAIEVYQQDARTGAHMDKDPEDVRYNFSRWSSNNAGFAIGPLRADPRTGQILDADILMNDGWIRGAVRRYENVIQGLATETLSPETLSWLDENPTWDPRIILNDPSEQRRLLAERRAMLKASGPRPHGGHRVAEAFDRIRAAREAGGLRGNSEHMLHTALCSHAEHRAMDMTLATLGMLDLSALESNGREIDEVPDEFVNALIKDVIMHEIGHVLGLRHNFVASTLYEIETINSEEMKDEAFTASVMDYNAANYNYKLGETQGAFFMPTIGPYDIWAIRYGYGADDTVNDVLAESTRDEHAYHTDENLFGPDPRARQRDMGKNTLEFVEMEMDFIQDLRSRILDRVVDEGDSWERVRGAYNSLLGQHVRNVVTAANHLGGSIVRRDRVGDADRDPISPVEADEQRRALAMVIDQTFYDESFGLTPELLSKMTYDKWIDQGFQAFFTPEAYDVHDRILGIQGTAMTLVLNPQTLRRTLDNEYRLGPDDDAFTLAELMDAITDATWSELEGRVTRRHTPRDPMVSSIRRNLQSEHVERLIDLSLPNALPGAASKPISDLAVHHLRQIGDRIEKTMNAGDSMVDAYTIAHLSRTKEKIDRALEAQFVYNRDDI